ncbi:hypothetical protein J3459_011291 [Metarhizium acridum]|uniref:uncharacterized protein n=1 Tax=Metarhizium acridum TaxID=92637 RepID=UPI001C6CFB49|nr:hypothetical protein J3458_009246 [Metarhizium acridum]KAG8420186.1 hypothetical protein J3459_011291 [Metarhizium acridum]
MSSTWHNPTEPQESPDHPSQSIPNAAYPDTPYQPGSGFHGDASTPASTGLATSVAGNNTTSHSASSTASPNQSAANTGPSSWHQAAALSTSIPDSPPPPYVRDEHSRPYITAQTRPASHWTGTPSNRRNEQPESVPLQSLSLASSSQCCRAPAAASITQHDQLPSACTTGSGSITASTRTVKLGSVAEARRRRRRRVTICLVLLAAVIVFVLALIIGIALGVIRNTARNDRNNGPVVK